MNIRNTHYYLLILVTLTIIGCGTSKTERVTVEKPVQYEVIIKEKTEPVFIPTELIATTRCYDHRNGAPLYGPQKTTDMIQYGDYAYITEYPSGRVIRICALCLESDL